MLKKSIFTPYLKSNLPHFETRQSSQFVISSSVHLISGSALITMPSQAQIQSHHHHHFNPVSRHLLSPKYKPNYSNCGNYNYSQFTNEMNQAHVCKERVAWRHVGTVAAEAKGDRGNVPRMIRCLPMSYKPFPPQFVLTY